MNPRRWNGQLDESLRDAGETSLEAIGKRLGTRLFDMVMSSVWRELSDRQRRAIEAVDTLAKCLDEDDQAALVAHG